MRSAVFMAFVPVGLAMLSNTTLVELRRKGNPEHSAVSFPALKKWKIVAITS